MDLTASLDVSAAGMDAQTARLQVIAENLANQDTTGSTPGADPYRRRTITFADAVNGTGDGKLVTVQEIGRDESAFPLKYDPSNPAANASGYVKLPNVNSFVEIMDMREAERSYSANLNAMQVSRSMLTRTIDMLK